jgi:hypothetical protein
LCFDAKAGLAKTSRSRTAVKIFFMVKMYHDPESGGSPVLARNQIRNEGRRSFANAKSSVN